MANRVWRRFAPSSLRLAGAVLEAAQASLPPERIRQLHAKPAQRVEELIHSGQSERESFVPISRQPGSSVCSTTSSKGQQKISAAVASIRQTPAIHRRNGARRLR